MADLAARRGATPTFVEGDVEMAFSYDLEVSDGATTCTQQREVRYMSGDGAGLRMQRAVAAGFGGVSLFAFGYEDDGDVERHRRHRRPTLQRDGIDGHDDRPPADRPG